MTERLHPPPEPVGLARRIAAMTYEGILLGAILILAAIPVVAVTGVTPESGYFPLFILYAHGIAFLYLGWFWVRGGQTLAMKTWKFRLVGAEDGGPVGWRTALLRYVGTLPYWLLFLLALYAPNTWPTAVALLPWIGLFAALAVTIRDPYKRMLHDVISGSLIVRAG